MSSADGFTPLHWAAFCNRSEVARQLIDHGADVNAVAENDSRVRPLHGAAASGANKVVSRLLEYVEPISIQGNMVDGQLFSPPPNMATLKLFSPPK